jgi:hypothetical protein
MKDPSPEDVVLRHCPVGLEGQCPIEHKNSKLEIRNSKKYQITKIQMTETVRGVIRVRNCDLVCLFLSLEH